jgi:AcrR family transcriptional regulator
MPNPAKSPVNRSVATPPRRTQAQRRDQSEQRLLIAAAQLIEAEGFAAVTFDRVGATAGYSRGLASQRFGSKDGLVRAVIAFVSARVRAKVETLTAGIAAPLDRLLAWVDVMLSQIEHDVIFRAYFVMMAAAIGNRDPLREAFLAAHEDVRTELRAMIEAGQQAGQINATLDADTLALSIGSLHLGIAVELLLDPALNMAAMRATVRESMVRMLGA